MENYSAVYAVITLSALLIVHTHAIKFDDYANQINSAESDNSSWSTYSNLWTYILKKKKPWLMLPDNGHCYQQFCSSSKDCCRKYNLCDRSARVCIDCWYGAPCRSPADCCERYPKCFKDRVMKGKQGYCAS